LADTNNKNDGDIAVLVSRLATNTLANRKLSPLTLLLLLLHASVAAAPTSIDIR